MSIIENTSDHPREIKVYDTLGQTIKTYHTTENVLLLDGLEWRKGVYVVIIKSENSNSVKKIIIN